MALLNRIEWQKPGLVRVQAGAELFDIDAATRPNGLELPCIDRLSDPRKSAASLPAAAAAWAASRRRHARTRQHRGGADRALEHIPRVIELRGDAAQKISRADGHWYHHVLEMLCSGAILVRRDCCLRRSRRRGAVGQTIAMADGIVEDSCRRSNGRCHSTSPRSAPTVPMAKAGCLA